MNKLTKTSPRNPTKFCVNCFNNFCKLSLDESVYDNTTTFPPFTAGLDREVRYKAHLQQCNKNSPCILSPPSNNILEFRGWKNAQKHPFAIYGDLEAFLVSTTTTADPLSPSDTLLNNVKKNFSIHIDDEEDVGMDHFADFCDEGDEEDNEDVDDIEEQDVPTSLTEATTAGGGGGKRKKSNKSMPDEEPHRKQLHPWFKSKRLEPTRKKARLDLARFVETNSAKHEHKMVMVFFLLSLLLLYIYFRLVMHSM